MKYFPFLKVFSEVSKNFFEVYDFYILKHVFAGGIGGILDGGAFLSQPQANFVLERIEIQTKRISSVEKIRNKNKSPR